MTFPPRVSLTPNDFQDRAGSRALPTGTVTLLLADIEGSTRLWESEPDVMAAALAAMDRTLAGLVHTHNGVCPIEQGEGDSFVVAFSRASDAVACALALQQAPLAPIRLRIGVHTGEVQLRDEGKYMGPTINRGARLRELGHGGQTLLSGTTSDVVSELLPAQSWLIDFGRHALRDRHDQLSSESFLRQVHDGQVDTLDDLPLGTQSWQDAFCEMVCRGDLSTVKRAVAVREVTVEFVERDFGML
jgi:class 3 adenylate cyclase